MMDRRAFLGIVALLAAPRAAGAQSDQAVRKIGVINTNAPNRPPGLNAFFWERMRELGWIDGRNFVVEYRDAFGDPARGLLQRATGEMVQLKVDIIVMTNGAAARLVQDITRTVPLCVFGGDLQQAGVVASLSRPGGNVTGVQALQPDLVGKRLALLKEVVPGLRRVGVLVQSRSGPFNTAFVRNTEDASRTLQLQVHVVESPQPGDLKQAFATLARAQVRGLLVVNHVSITSRQSEVVALAARNRLPAIYEYKVWTEAGGLISYGPAISDVFRQLAECADKILRGAKPEDLPVQQPTKFDLSINLKTARALGLTLSSALLQRADQVID